MAQWRLEDLAGLGDDPTLRIHEQTLKTNWRSEARIVRFNNAIFTAAVQILNHRHEDETGQTCLQLLNAYSDVCQQTAKQDEQGYVRLTFLPGSQELPYAEATLEELAKEVERLVAAGIHTTDIAILVRKTSLSLP